jgi:predicted RNase H-like HicB family nuclease
MLRIEIEREEDSRWIGEVPELPWVIAYGATANEARNRAAALALRVTPDRIERREPAPIQADDLFASSVMSRTRG